MSDYYNINKLLIKKLVDKRKNERNENMGSLSNFSKEEFEKILNDDNCLSKDPYMYTCTSNEYRKNDYDLKLVVLTEENEKLKNDYSILLQKTSKLVEAYRQLETENKKLKIKKERQYLLRNFLLKFN